MKIKEMPNYDRPREKLLKNGPTFLTNEELIQVIIGSGIKGNDVTKISKNIFKYLEKNINQFKSNFDSFFQGLNLIKGLGKAKACLIVASFEFFSRLTSNEKSIIKSACDLLPTISYIASKKQEYFLCVNLNGANRIISNRVITIGLVDQTLIHPREVFSDAVKERAAKVIVAHNHPAGILSPSEEDIKITRSLQEASKVLGITLLDHIILTKDGYFSFKEEGLM